MAKQTRKKPEILANVENSDTFFKLERLHDLHPWDVQHHPDCSEIEAYVELSGEWELVATIKGANHIEISQFILSLVNAHNQDPSLLELAVRTLEFCLKSKRLNWSEERNADVVVRRARELLIKKFELNA